MSASSAALIASVTSETGMSLTTKKAGTLIAGPGFRGIVQWLTGDPVRPGFRKAKPGKLVVQRGDGFGRALPRSAAERGGCRWRGHQGAAGSLVAPVGFAAERSDAA
jgi:hypothetical protein